MLLLATNRRVDVTVQPVIAKIDTRDTGLRCMYVIPSHLQMEIVGAPAFVVMPILVPQRLTKSRQRRTVGGFSCFGFRLRHSRGWRLHRRMNINDEPQIYYGIDPATELARVITPLPGYQV